MLKEISGWDNKNQLMKTHCAIMQIKCLDKSLGKDVSFSPGIDGYYMKALSYGKEDISEIHSKFKTKFFLKPDWCLNGFWTGFPHLLSLGVIQNRGPGSHRVLNVRLRWESILS